MKRARKVDKKGKSKGGIFIVIEGRKRRISKTTAFLIGDMMNRLRGKLA